MARLDGTGPLGQGSMTGRGLGNCTTNAGVNAAKGIRYGAGVGAGLGLGLGLGCGLGRRMGRGRRANGFANQNNVQASNETRKAALERQLQQIQSELDSMNN